MLFILKYSRRGGASGAQLERARAPLRPAIPAMTTVVSTFCTFHARLPPGCVCAVALRGAADGTGGGVLFPSALEGLNAFRCPESVPSLDDASAPSDTRLEDLALRLECDPSSRCVSSVPVDLAPAVRSFFPRGEPVEAFEPLPSAPRRHHLGVVAVAERPAFLPPRRSPDRVATPPVRVASTNPRRRLARIARRLFLNALKAAFTVAVFLALLAGKATD